MAHIKKTLTLLFLCALGTPIYAAIEGDDFELYVHQWDNAHTLDVAKLSLEQDNDIAQTVEDHQLTTRSGISVPVTFYNRESGTLIVAAQGLPAPKESMNFLITLFPHYDILLFDYRWCHQYEWFLGKALIAREPVKRVLIDEVEELATAVHFALRRKKYSAIVGLGECYSCFHLAKLQADSVKKRGRGPFTHLVLDSCWSSLRHFAERICFDPFLPISPQEGGAPKIITWLTDSYLFKMIVLESIFKFLPNVSIQPYLATLDIPVLFIHGRRDLFVPNDHFETIWQATDAHNRALLSTPSQHADNLSNKALYRAAIEAFISSSTMATFEKNLVSMLYVN